ncbi:MAG: hypothetical protein GY940_06830 [bacterium]|nr:hypothetical protein [bacterium]
MKSLLKKYPLPEMLLILGGGVFLLFSLLSIDTPASVSGKAFNSVVNTFDKSYRVNIAYFGAFIVAIGSLVLLFKTLWGKREQPRPDHLDIANPVVTSPKATFLTHALIFVLCLLMFKLVYFPVAFAFSLASGALLLFRNRYRPWKLFFVSLLVLSLFLSPYLFRGQAIHMKIADVMDAWVPQQKVLAESGKALSLNPDTKIDNLINGIRISGFVNSGLNVITWLFMIFSPFTAFALNVFIMAFTAFWGMRLLLSKYIITEGDNHNPYRQWIINGSALCFALLPFYPSGGLSIAGLPLLLYCFLNIRNNDWSKKDYAYIAFFPFYSVLPFAGLFIMIALLIIFVIDFIRNKYRFHTPYFIGLAVLGVFYFLTHFHLIYSVLDPGFSSYREELVIAPLSFAACFKGLIHNFIFDRGNIIMAQQVFLILAAAAAVVLGITRKLKEVKLLLLLIGLTLFNAFLWGFKYWEGIHFLREKFQILNALNLARFYWLNPFLWYLLFAVSLLIISKFRFGRLAVSFLLIGQLVFMFTHYNPEFRHLSGRPNPYPYSLSYKQYYSEPLFKKINQFIGQPKEDYRVASLGIPPGIAQYNGFYTLDIFSNAYPLEYKHRFRRIVEKELAKSEDVKKVIDANGKRLYLLSAELHKKKKRGLTFARGISKNQQHLTVKQLDLNTSAFKEMGGQYIFSAVEIQNQTQTGLSLEASRCCRAQKS